MGVRGRLEGKQDIKAEGQGLVFCSRRLSPGPGAEVRKASCIREERVSGGVTVGSLLGGGRAWAWGSRWDCNLGDGRRKVGAGKAQGPQPLPEKALLVLRK